MMKYGKKFTIEYETKWKNIKEEFKKERDSYKDDKTLENKVLYVDFKTKTLIKEEVGYVQNQARFEKITRDKRTNDKRRVYRRTKDL